MWRWLRSSLEVSLLHGKKDQQITNIRLQKARTGIVGPTYSSRALGSFGPLTAPPCCVTRQDLGWTQGSESGGEIFAACNALPVSLPTAYEGTLSFVVSDRCDTLGVSRLVNTPCRRRSGGSEEVGNRPQIPGVWWTGGGSRICQNGTSPGMSDPISETEWVEPSKLQIFRPQRWRHCV